MALSARAQDRLRKACRVDEDRLPTRTYALALAAIVGLALVLRLVGFGSIPSGLYHDEAYNGLDALAVLRGAHPLWFPANNGREPFFIYLVALSVAVLGRTVVAVRAPALLLGLLTVPATAFLGSSLFGRRVGLLSAAVTAITFWPVHLSRIGFRAVGLPLFTALALGFLWRGLQKRRGRDLAVAGLCYGLSFYTYLAARFTPVPLLLAGALSLWPAARLPRPGRRQLLLFGGVALIVLAPLLGYVALHPDALGTRAAQVALLNPAISHGDPWGTLVRQTLAALGAFFVRGDRIPRHNLPWRPIFDPALGLAFLLGCYVALKRRAAGWFVLLWVGAMLLPTILAEDTPHFLRGVGILPVAFILPALGLSEAWNWLARRGRAMLGSAVVALALLIGLASTAYSYLGPYAHSQAAYYFFESGSTELARRVNAFLGGGARDGSRVAYISERLWRDWPSLRFLLPEGPNLRVIPTQEPPPALGASEVLLAAWPYEVYQPALQLLPAGSTIEVASDLYERGDLDPQARQLALVFRAGAMGQEAAPLATLEQDIRLVRAQVESAGDSRLQVKLEWQAAAPLKLSYTAFVQVWRGQAIQGQDDSPPCAGLLPTTLWRPGDRVVDVHEVSLKALYDPKTDRVVVGLYDRATMTRLRVLDSVVPAPGDAIPLAAP